MRFFIVIAAFLLIPAFAVVMEWRFQRGQRAELLALGRARLARAGFDQVNLALDHFDAQLTGTCSDPADREKAQSLVTSVRGVRVRPEDNQIHVPAKLVANIQGHELHLSGWLPAEKQRVEIIRLVKALRPDLNLLDADIHISPQVELGLEFKTQEGSQPKVFTSLLESIRLPPSLSITGDARHFVLKGNLPSATQRDAIVNAARQAAAPGVEIDVSQFMANEHVAAAPFADGPGLENFVRVFLASPAPGSFQIDARNGPRIQAYATPAMESALLTALRPISGGAYVKMDLTLVPSIYHLPMYQTQSKLEPGAADALREAFRAETVYFDSGSSRLKADEEAKLGILAGTIKNAGPGLHLIVAGYADVGGEPGAASKAVQQSRAGVVRSRLVEMGVAADSLEAMAFEAVHAPGPLTDQGRRDTRCVELLIK